MDRELVFVVRLFVAGLLGALIGLEREYRAKEAGMRTHFLVALGSALMMIVSQWGFLEFLGFASSAQEFDTRLDPSRVAAQVVSGIGFIGAGTIMMHKQFVRGLTTAAGLWAVAGIGLAAGGGMYILAVGGTLLALFGLELLQFVTRRLKSRYVHVVLLTSAPDNLAHVTDELYKNDFSIMSFSISDKTDAQGRIKVNMYVREHFSTKNESPLMTFFQQFPELTIEKME